MSQKSERLVNLTIALLSTQRYLTKSEIFKNVAGYEGEPEARDRMFERDKEDLRSLGITIELGTFDPLFDDEAGYRIKAEDYSLQLSDLTPTQLLLLSRASQAWSEALMQESAQSGIRKLKALGIEVNLSEVGGEAGLLPSPPEQLPEIIESLAQRRLIRFDYISSDNQVTLREVAPYRLARKNGHWYLHAIDKEKEELRSFRLDRFASEVSAFGRHGAFEIDEEALSHHLNQSPEKIAVLHIRKKRGQVLRSIASTQEIDEDWDRLTLKYFDLTWLAREILWLGDDAIAIEPPELREMVISQLKAVISRHG